MFFTKTKYVTNRRIELSQYAKNSSMLSIDSQ